MPTKTAKKTAKKRSGVKAPAVEFSNAPETTAKKKAAKKTTPAKKRAVAKKAAAKKSAPATKVAKKAVKKSASKAVGGQALPRDLNEHGFVVGSDSAKIADVLLEGGASRHDINEKVEKALGKNKKTRNGNAPNVSSLIANVLRRLKDKGYFVEETWVLMPPTPATKARATKAAKAREASTSDTPAKRRKPSATGAKKAPAKKVAKKRPARK